MGQVEYFLRNFQSLLLFQFFLFLEEIQIEGLNLQHFQKFLFQNFLDFLHLIHQQFVAFWHLLDLLLQENRFPFFFKKKKKKLKLREISEKKKDFI